MFNSCWKNDVLCGYDESLLDELGEIWWCYVWCLIGKETWWLVVGFGGLCMKLEDACMN